MTKQTKTRIVFTAVLLAIGLISFGPIADSQKDNSGADTGIQYSLTRKLGELGRVWVTLKMVNGVINVLQSAEIGASFFAQASINPFEFLAPVDNLLDKLSNLLLLAMGAVTLEKLVLALSGFMVFKAIVPACAVLCILTMWIQQDMVKISRIIPVFCLISLSISAAVPLSLAMAAIAENRLRSNHIGRVLSEMDKKAGEAKIMENEVTGLKAVGKAIMGFFDKAKELGNAAADDFINYITVFFVTNLLIPIITIYGLLCFTKYCARLMLGNR